MRNSAGNRKVNGQKRAGKRVCIGLDAELGPRCMAFTGNISEGGLYLKIAYTEPPGTMKPGTRVRLAIELPSGKLLNLQCKKVWSHKNTSSSLIEHIGVEVINPPEEYRYLCHRLRLQNFNWQ